MNLLFLIMSLYINVGCHQYTEPEIYLVPKGFTGRVSIVFNQKNGNPIKYENNKRVYEISTEGICLTQFKPTYGITNRQYYYVDSIGSRTQLPIYTFEHKPDGTIKWIVNDTNKIGIFLDGTTGQYADDDKAPFQETVVSTFSNMDSFFTKQYKKQFEESLKKQTGLNISIP